MGLTAITNLKRSHAISELPDEMYIAAKKVLGINLEKPLSEQHEALEKLRQSKDETGQGYSGKA